MSLQGLRWISLLKESDHRWMNKENGHHSEASKAEEKVQDMFFKRVKMEKTDRHRSPPMTGEEPGMYRAHMEKRHQPIRLGPIVLARQSRPKARPPHRFLECAPPLRAPRKMYVRPSLPARQAFGRKKSST